MGVPSFFRWLVEKFPKVVSNAVEEKGEGLNYSMPNPNGMEFDNFYLDMNGIIHPCFHPEDNNNLSPPTTYDEVFSNIYEYIDRLFNIVRPRKLLFMAIDGVAPRAKMNQQRARRFRTAKDIQLAEEMEEKLRKQFEREGKALLPKEESQIADSNVITPGTEFMHELSKKLQSYISLRMSQNPAWANIKVILSDDTVPGEGEHKIMSFIRAQRSSPGYNPNTRHCLYGLDADLIMLALATHEIHFSILREEVLSPDNQFSHVTISKSSTSRADTHCLKSRGWFKEHPCEESSSESVTKLKNLVSCNKDIWTVKKLQHYQFLNVWILREYLALDLKIPSAENFECDLERIVDDFIFICFFAGNDFLPHIPSLEIHEGCIDLLMHVYKNEFQNLGGYFVDMQKVDDRKGGYVKFKRVERFILMVGSYEEKIFSKRSQLRERRLRRILLEHRDAKECEKNEADDGRSSDIAVSCRDVDAHGESKASASAVDIEKVLENTKELKQKLKDNIRNQSDLFKDGCLGTDTVKFGTPGWRERYYKEKFCAQSAHEIEATRKDVVAKYGEGLCWVLLYYFSGVPSWTWFYPYHYGPLASDLKGLSQTRVRFQKGLPFKPFDQLMGVLPPSSAHALPLPYKELMIDNNSNIIDFYPTEFKTDTDGKRYMWQGICKLPFIDEGRLLIETKKLENELKDFEKSRNMESLHRLFVRCLGKESRLVLYGETRTASKKIKDAITVESTIEGIYGTIHLMPEDLIEAGDDSKKGNDARNDLCLFYEIAQGFQHVPRLLERVNIPEKTVNEEDLMETTLWHEASNGKRFHSRRPRLQDRSPAFISKGAGRGFLGRGKSPADTRLESPGPANQMSSSSSWGRGFNLGRGKSPADTRLESPGPASQMSSSSSWGCGFNLGRGKSPADTRLARPEPASQMSSCSSWGHGFNLGRGKSPADTRLERPEPASQMSSSSSSSWGRGSRGHRPCGANYGCDYRGFQGLRISDSNTRPVSNFRPRQVGSDFWPSGRGASEDWRLNRPSRADSGGSWEGNYGGSPGPAWNTSTGCGRGRGDPGGSWQGNYAGSPGPVWNMNTGRGLGRGDPGGGSWQGNYGGGPGPAWNTSTGRGRGRGGSQY